MIEITYKWLNRLITPVIFGFGIILAVIFYMVFIPLYAALVIVIACGFVIAWWFNKMLNRIVEKEMP